MIIKGECSVELLRENEDGSVDFAFNFPKEALDALTRLGILTAIQAGIEDAKRLNPDNTPKKPVDFPEQEPVAGCLRCNTPKKCALYGCCPNTWPSEATPPRQPEPLTDEQIRKVNQEVWGYVSKDHTKMWEYARAIEAAHNIGEKA